MIPNPANSEAFITLIAHEPESQLVAELSAYFGKLIVITNSQAETESLLKEKRFKLICMDLNITRCEFVAQIRSTQHHYSDLPIIALTNTIDLARRKELITSGFDDCLAKPLTVAKVDEVISLWLNQTGSDSALTSAHNLLIKCRYNRQLAATLYQKVIEQFPQRLETIGHAIKALDYSSAYDGCHALDSEARICFLNEIALAAKSLGQLLRQKSAKEISENYEELKLKVIIFLNESESILEFLTDK